MFQGSCRNAKRVLKETSRSFKGCFKHFNEFQYCFRSFKIAIDSRVFQVCFMGVLRKLQGCFKSTSKVLKRRFQSFEGVFKKF